MQITAYALARRFIGEREIAGLASNPLILAMLQLDERTISDDATAWCSAFVGFVAWLLELPRSRSLAARSWLTIGRPVDLDEAIAAFDVVVLSRGSNPALGHVGYFSRTTDGIVDVLGGNQSNAVSVAPFDRGRVLGVRRLVG